jgi:histidinol-phosphate aminotransferase
MLQELIRPSIRALRAYQSARSLVTTGRVFLDANESAEAAAQAAGLNRYPLPQPTELRERFAGLYGVDPQQVLIGRGSDEAIDLLVRTFCEPGADEILITPPTYGMYEVAAGLQNAAVHKIPLRRRGPRWELPAEELVARVHSNGGHSKLLFVCSPNNPTAAPFPLAQLRELCRAVAGRAVVIVDEAYAEFAVAPGLLPYLDAHSNLIILRTLSKAWALAGIRCGVALASAEVIAVLRKVIAPYPLPQPCIDIALAQLSAAGISNMERRVDRLRDERERLAGALQALPQVRCVYPSQTNFLLVEFVDPRQVVAATAARGVIVRDRSADHGLAGCVRITVGTPEENALLLCCLRELPPA